MKRSEEVRFPHSAELFRFCREALNIKHNYEVKVIDQHVGSILGYDPADCSHWKNGKKDIKSVQAINAIAKYFEVDPRLVTDIVSGKSSCDESLLEYKEYSLLSINYANQFPDITHTNPTLARQAIISNDRKQYLLALAAEILHKCNIKTYPIMLPELLSITNNIIFEAKLDKKGILSTSFQDGKYTINVNLNDTRPYMRFWLAKEIGRTLLYPELIYKEEPDLRVIASINLFAGYILMPKLFIQESFRRVDNTRDLVQQLSDMFWVSRSVVNFRLREIVAESI